MVNSVVSAGPASAAPSASARWIWSPASSPNQWVAFRKTFTLDGAPGSAVTAIAVDSKYWLWVNGQLVTFEGGLKRGPAPNDTYYDEIDLAPYLSSGRNTVAILAWYFGKSAFSHKDSGQGGLLFSSSITAGASTTTLVSDTSWRVTPHAGYKNNTAGGQPSYRIPEGNVYYDARDATGMKDWTLPTFSDAGWPTATDKGALGAAPWNALAKRPIPPFRFGSLTRYTNDTSLPSAGQGGTPIVARLPTNIQITPYLKVDAPAGETIGIQTDHYNNDNGGNSVRATYITTGGVQEFEALAWMNGTTVEYTIPGSVTILELSYRESGYPTDFVGSFRSSDPYFDVLWQKAARTMYVNLRDTYLDCPDRERGQWWGDAVHQFRQGFYTFDTRVYAMTRKAIDNLVAWQKPNGPLFSPIPGTWASELPLQSLAAIWSFWEYYTYTGDADAITHTYPAVKKYLDLYTLDSAGLVNHRAGDWDWPDWGNNFDKRVLDNAWYYMALDTTIKLAALSGNDADVAGWEARKKSISDNFNRVLWDTARQEYRSPGYTGDTDDRGNALAVVAGLARAADHQAINTVLTRHFNSSPYMEFYVLEALYRMGFPHTAEARMKTRWAAQVYDPGHTLWEYWTKGGGGTQNHAWSGGPLFALSAYAAGVRPTDPGYTTYQVVPRMGSLTALTTKVPSVKGMITVDLDRKTNNRLTMAVTSPSGTRAKVGVPTFSMSGVTIKAGGTTVYTGGSSTGSVSGLTYSGKDTDYVYFTVEPGTWNFDSTGSGATAPDNLAERRTVTSNNSLENRDWGVNRLTDGVIAGVSGAKGYTSNHVTAADVTASPIWVQADLGADSFIDAVRLMPRSDTPAVGGGTAGFPVDFTIQTRPGTTSDWTTVRTVTGQANPDGTPQTYGFRPTTARHVRVHATRLGSPANDEPEKYRLQLAELQVPPVARTVTADNPLFNNDWHPMYVLDGNTTSVAGARGYTSNPVKSADISGNPTWLQVDLGADRPIRSLVLYPRTGTGGVGGGSAGFPVDFAVQTRPHGSGDWTTVRAVTGQANPAGVAQTYTLTDSTARHLRILVTRLGAPAADETTNYRLQLAELRVG
ncbi:discoidin domain-containing protein [Streptomyces sp. S3(2020)]|uniref:alpha-L-rhamnosidase-related protein n=1 Tax=Streptomyces sp. S3(2020) TaxID=2732044 RepID=UPI003217F462